MTSDALSVLQALFDDRGPAKSIWKLFTSWTVPGTHFSPAEWMLFALTLVLLFRFWRRVTHTESSGGAEE